VIAGVLAKNSQKVWYGYRRSIGLLTGPADSRRAHADRFSDPPPRESLPSKLKSPISLEQRSRPANGPSAASSILFRSRQPCPNSFGYPDSLLFGETGQQADDDVAERAGAINPRFGALSQSGRGRANLKLIVQGLRPSDTLKSACASPNSPPRGTHPSPRRFRPRRLHLRAEDGWFRAMAYVGEDQTRLVSRRRRFTSNSIAKRCSMARSCASIPRAGHSSKNSSGGVEVGNRSSVKAGF
jgi:hypothetical protein